MAPAGTAQRVKLHFVQSPKQDIPPDIQPSLDVGLAFDIEDPALGPPQWTCRRLGSQGWPQHQVGLMGFFFFRFHSCAEFSGSESGGMSDKFRFAGLPPD
ncbi:hypothetical protein MSAN_00105200 [Mycena sanguinolenta]|uniref:Uncharacterized protein n=1 Tax=Mycena sanguinolenta TaxID=230812 RepID=A0A8H6ZHC5_9AGAR|nr:hypothetical protein MSAN_00105200 [Mycena sanguinolenta]